MIEEKNFSKLIELVDIVGYQQMVINGQPMRQEVHTTNVCCPECGQSIFEFQAPRDDVLMRRYLLENKEGLPLYCPKCGQKLVYAYKPIDGEWEVLSEEPVDESMGD